MSPDFIYGPLGVVSVICEEEPPRSQLHSSVIFCRACLLYGRGYPPY